MKLQQTAEQLVAAANSQVEALTVAEAISLAGDDNTLIIDVRDIRELKKEGRIPGSLHVPRGFIEFWADPASPYHHQAFASGKKLLLHCALGWRSALAARSLQEMGVPNVAHIEGGFNGWKDAGRPGRSLGCAAGEAGRGRRIRLRPRSPRHWQPQVGPQRGRSASVGRRPGLPDRARGHQGPAKTHRLRAFRLCQTHPRIARDGGRLHRGAFTAGASTPTGWFLSPVSCPPCTAPAACKTEAAAEWPSTCRTITISSALPARLGQGDRRLPAALGAGPVAVRFRRH